MKYSLIFMRLVFLLQKTFDMMILKDKNFNLQIFLPTKTQRARRKSASRFLRSIKKIIRTCRLVLQF
jgi:hypothetical protein